jgi:hypothetical protein
MSPSRFLLALAVAVCASPALASGAASELHLLDAELTLAPRAADLAPRARVLVALADPAAATTAGGGLDFDLLGSTTAAPVDEAAERAGKRRRTMLNWHQGVGMALMAAELGTTVFGQLSYSDKFAGSAPANTNKWRGAHAAFAVSTLGLFATNGILALLAPSPPDRKYKLDRVMVHRISMALAAAGMIAQGYYGIRTSGREGYTDQAGIAKTHLAIGYATIAAMYVGVGAIAF